MQMLRAILDMAGNVISNLGTPVAGTDAATKDYADTKVADTGDTMTGLLTIDRAATAGDTLLLTQDLYPTLRFVKEQGAANAKQWNIYVSGPAAESGASAASLTFLAENDDYSDTGTIRMYRDGHMVLGSDPVGSLDAATKQYVDTYTATATIVYQSGWVTASGTSTMITKHSGMVTLELNSKPTADTAISVSSGIVIGTVPAGFRPANAQVMLPAVITTSTSTYVAGFIWIDTAGLVKVRSYSSVTITTASGAVQGVLTYRQGN